MEPATEHTAELTENTSPAHHHTHDHHVVIAVVVALIVGLLLGGFYVASMNKTTSMPKPYSPQITKTSQQSVTPILTQTSIPTPTTADTSKWKAYTNKTYGYSLKYP